MDIDRTVTVDRPTGAGRTVTHQAACEPEGIAGLVAPLLSSAVQRLGDEAETGLRGALVKP